MLDIEEEERQLTYINRFRMKEERMHYVGTFAVDQAGLFVIRTCSERWTSVVWRAVERSSGYCEDGA